MFKPKAMTIPHSTNVETKKYNVESIRKQFPILNQAFDSNKPLVYLDNAATSQKPKAVIDCLTHYYESINSNVHRGIHTLADRATNSFEKTRTSVSKFINSKFKEEIIFTKGTTESINLVAYSYGKTSINKNDEIILSSLEHHSNIVPWQILAQQTGAIIKVIDILEDGTIDLEHYYNLLNGKTKIVAVNHASNSLGIINPIKNIIDHAHSVGAKVLIDGAQGVPHLEVDVQELNCDFYAFSAHKCYGPTGVGILYGKHSILEEMSPYQGGGEMIKEVSFEHTSYNSIPYKFEAGTPNIAGVIAFNESLKFINKIGYDQLQKHEKNIYTFFVDNISMIPNIKLIGDTNNKVCVLSFLVDNIHSFDIGQMLDSYGIAVRTGHHCTQPLMKKLGIEGTIRASFAAYNTKNEVIHLIESLEKIIKRLG